MHLTGAAIVLTALWLALGTRLFLVRLALTCLAVLVACCWEPDVLGVEWHFGLSHITNSEPTTWYYFAAEILRLSGMEVKLEPITPAELGRPAKRPLNSVLHPHPLPQEMPSWRTALREYLALRKELCKA